MIWDEIFRGMGPGSHAVPHRIKPYSRTFSQVAAIALLLFFAVLPLHGRTKNKQDYGAGLIVNIPHPESEIAPIVDDVAQNTIIRGTKEYNKDEFVAGATAVRSTPLFAAWTDGGKVFYKVRTQALNPQNFKDSADVGTLAVRYVVQPQGDQNTVLRIDAVFVEDFRHSVHPSDGSVESNEFKDIQDRIDAVELMKKETAEAIRIKQERAVRNFGQGNGSADSKGNETVQLSTPPAPVAGENASGSGSALVPQTPTSQTAIPQAPESTYQSPPSGQSAETPTYNSQAVESAESLQQRVAELRREVQRLVRKPGAALKAAPFHTANTLKSLDPGVEVLILISTTYWYGVETRDGEHGWILREQLEQLP